MRRKGRTKGEISRILGVDNDFINRAITEAVMPEGRTWQPDYSDTSDIGGY